MFSRRVAIPAGKNRTEVLEQGRAFSEYIVKEPFNAFFLIKYFMRTESESALSVHTCSGCHATRVLSQKELYSYHFRKLNKLKGKTTVDDSLSFYTPYLQKEMRALFNVNV